ncbi:MAG: energy-coupling factor transporter ATPase [Oscillospiraceae bacterium]|nr:energy-coupling factor transporter ATPase [Oscillospiraceae bacterium]
MEPIITTKNLTHIYSRGTPFEHTAIQGVDFEAYPGEYLCVIGHTGSGKSTFIQHLNGLLKPTEGTVLFEGQDIHGSKAFTHSIRFQVGLVFQYPEYQLFEETVRKDIAFGPRNMKLSPEEIERRVQLAAQWADLDEALLEKSPFDLSGGQKRRVAIAGVMAMQPKVLILDEPTAGLDPDSRAEVMANIERYRRTMNACIIMVSHSMEDAAENADRIFVFHDSRLELRGTPAEVFCHSRELQDMGLAIPKAAQIALRLRDMGMELPEGLYTNEQLKRALLQRKGGAGLA